MQQSIPAVNTVLAGVDRRGGVWGERSVGGGRERECGRNGREGEYKEGGRRSVEGGRGVGEEGVWEECERGSV